MTLTTEIILNPLGYAVLPNTAYVVPVLGHIHVNCWHIVRLYSGNTSTFWSDVGFHIYSQILRSTSDQHHAKTSHYHNIKNAVQNHHRVTHENSSRQEPPSPHHHSTVLVRLFTCSRGLALLIGEVVAVTRILSSTPIHSFAQELLVCLSWSPAGHNRYFTTYTRAYPWSLWFHVFRDYMMKKENALTQLHHSSPCIAVTILTHWVLTSAMSQHTSAKLPHGLSILCIGMERQSRKVIFIFGEQTSTGVGDRWRNLLNISSRWQWAVHCANLGVLTWKYTQVRYVIV